MYCCYKIEIFFGTAGYFCYCMLSLQRATPVKTQKYLLKLASLNKKNVVNLAILATASFYCYCCGCGAGGSNIVRYISLISSIRCSSATP